MLDQRRHLIEVLVVLRCVEWRNNSRRLRNLDYFGKLQLDSYATTATTTMVFSMKCAYLSWHCCYLPFQVYVSCLNSEIRFKSSISKLVTDLTLSYLLYQVYLAHLCAKLA